ncbi:MAG: RNA modification enzyme, MiaB family, partial [Clostridia bacterium 41_269]
MPLQSGSNRILKLMGRNYTVEDYGKIVEKAREYMPDISIMSDVIVGFPGEKEIDHQATINAVRSFGINKIHVFPYSPRPGTPAEAIKEHVRPDIKKQRVEEMNRLSEVLSLDFHKKLLGKKLEVLVEKTCIENGIGIAEGFSEYYALVRFKFNDKSILGKIVPVKAEEAYTWGLKGSIKKDV